MKALTELPQDIWKIVIQKWLMIEDLCKFDSAICSTEWRLHCLPYLHSDEGPWLMSGYLEAPLTFKSVNWLDFRNLLVNTIKIDGSFPLNWKNHQSAALNTVICDHFLDEGSVLALAECMKISPLHRLVIRNFRLIDGNHMMMLLSACFLHNKSLVSLELSSAWAVNDDALKLIASKCTSLLSICFRDCRNITSAALMGVLNANLNLVRIDISGGWCTEIDDFALHYIASHLPRIVDLNISKCGLMTTPAVLKVISSCRQLRRLNVQGCYKVDQAQVREAMKHIVAMNEYALVPFGPNVTPATPTMTVEADTSALVVFYHRVTGDVVLCCALMVAFNLLHVYLSIYHPDYVWFYLAKRHKEIPIILDIALLYYYRHNLWWAWKNPRLAWPAFCRSVKHHYSGKSNRTALRVIFVSCIGSFLPSIMLEPVGDLLNLLSELVFGDPVEVAE